MPTTFVSLLIFVGFLTPGFIYASQRRRLAPQTERSAMMETASVVTTSLITNLIVVSIFGLIRWSLPEHTPDVGASLRLRSGYWVPNVPYVLAWGVLLLSASCSFAFLAAQWKKPRKFLQGKLGHVINDSSAWCEALNTTEDKYVETGIEMSDGSFVRGRVVWFSTSLEESGDREIILGPPLERWVDGAETPISAARVVVSARDIHRIDIAYVTDTPEARGEVIASDE